jgi:N-acetyl-anhydromuramyl-L-alanine amidase AmpD
MAKGMTQVTHITVHCSATQAKSNIGAKEINEMHLKRGFARIGYHFVITRMGEVQKGRELEATGAHVAGHNTGNIGICLIGGLDKNLKPEANFTDDQYHALSVLISDLLKKYPKAELLGHRDWPGVKKDCPCFDVRKWWHETMNPAI